MKAGSSAAANRGVDVFGLQAAGRVNAIGCPMQRAAPQNEHEERLGLTGIPDCTFYGHAASTDTATGFVVKFNDNGDESQRGNKNNKFQKSVTGFVQTSVTGFATSIAPCTGTGDRQTHELTGSANCAKHPGGCSCLVLAAESKVAGTTDTFTHACGADDACSGMRIRITSGKAAGYEGVISAFKHASAVYYTIPALPEMPDEHSKFTLQPLNSLQPNVHLAACTATSGMGCTAYGVEWAKTIGWPVGQAKLTSNTPTNVETGVRGPWTAVGGGTTVTSATNIQLALADEVKDANHYQNYLVEITSQDAATTAKDGFKVEAVARVTASSLPEKADTGGHLTIECPDTTACPVAEYYRIIAKTSATTGVDDLGSKGTYQQSMPQSISMMDSDVYIGGHFKGFDRFRFGIEGVDETVGYRSVHSDTWETYLVKLSD